MTGKYLDNEGINEINEYLNTANIRIDAITIISSQSSKIVKETAARLYSEQPDLIRPGGNSYTTRRYATCLRDIDYYLRYASYSLLAGNIDILNERLLDGLRETYLSLNVPIGPAVRSIQILKEVVLDKIRTTQIDIITVPFDYITLSLSEQSI